MLILKDCTVLFDNRSYSGLLIEYLENSEKFWINIADNEHAVLEISSYFDDNAMRSKIRISGTDQEGHTQILDLEHAVEGKLNFKPLIFSIGFRK